MLFKQLQSDEDDEPKPFKKINQYLILKCVGEGTFAKVYYAIDVNTKKEFALKKFKLGELQTIDSGISQLEREIHMMRILNHPNILSLHEVLYVEQKDIVYLVIDYADCGSLDSIIRNQKYILDDNLIRGIFAQILHALECLNKHGIVHEDIKPSNILISSKGKAYLSDFGVGHTTQSFDMAVGSPAYQAPESFQDNIDFRNLDPSKEDIWSLGVTLYQAFFGKLPYEGESVFEIVAKIKTTPLYIPKGTDPVKVSLLKQMLCVNHIKRFNVYQTLQHQFFANKSEEFDASLIEQMERPVFDPSSSVISVHATVCDESFSFSRPTITPQAQLRAINSDSSESSFD